MVPKTPLEKCSPHTEQARLAPQPLRRCSNLLNARTTTHNNNINNTVCFSFPSLPTYPEPVMSGGCNLPSCSSPFATTVGIIQTQDSLKPNQTKRSKTKFLTTSGPTVRCPCCDERCWLLRKLQLLSHNSVCVPPIEVGSPLSFLCTKAAHTWYVKLTWCLAGEALWAPWGIRGSRTTSISTPFSDLPCLSVCLCVISVQVFTTVNSRPHKKAAPNLFRSCPFRRRILCRRFSVVMRGAISHGVPSPNFWASKHDLNMVNYH